MLQVGLADRGDSTAHLQVRLCLEARKKPKSRFVVAEEKNSIGSVSLARRVCMHAVWLSLEAETQHSKIRSVTVTLLGFLAVLVHATFVEHRK